MENRERDDEDGAKSETMTKDWERNVGKLFRTRKYGDWGQIRLSQTSACKS